MHAMWRRKLRNANGGNKRGQKFGLCRSLTSARYTIRNLTTHESWESFSEDLEGGLMRSGEVLLAADKCWSCLLAMAA